MAKNIGGDNLASIKNLDTLWNSDMKIRTSTNDMATKPDRNVPLSG